MSFTKMASFGFVFLFLFLSSLSYGYAAENNNCVNSTARKCLRIAVPANPFSKKLVKVNQDAKKYSGFCINVWKEVYNLLKPEFDYNYVEFDGSYDDLVNSVANKTYDAAVGDITITSQRWTKVEFSEPFTESGLTTVVPVKLKEGWILFKPFDVYLWIATGGILIYTMFVVWFIEHRSNPEFSGPWKDQLGSALWFTFCSLFFAHRERVNRGHTRVVVVVWLFTVLILIQSYTANLTSMLTVTSLSPNIDSLSVKNVKIGCDNHTFLTNYVQDELNIGSEQIVNLVHDDDYLKAFQNGSIQAAFLEIPYAKLFVNTYCKEFTVTGSSYRFGGLSFAFQKGSGLAYNVSRAILKLSENRTLKQLEEKWLTPSSVCSDSNTTDNTDSLSLLSFWGLYLFCAATSTISFIVFVVSLLKGYRQHRQTRGDDINESVWKKFTLLLRYLKDAEPDGGRLARTGSKIVPEIGCAEIVV